MTSDNKRDVIWKILSVSLLLFWCVIGVHLVIISFNEESYWECSFYVVTEYLLLNLTKDVTKIKLDEDKQKDKKGE